MPAKDRMHEIVDKFQITYIKQISQGFQFIRVTFQWIIIIIHSSYNFERVR